MIYALIAFVAVVGFGAAMLCALAFAADLYNTRDTPEAERCDAARERIRLGLIDTNRRSLGA